MEGMEKCLTVEALVLSGGNSPLKFYVCLKNGTLSKQKRILLEHNQLLDAEHCRSLLATHVFNFAVSNTSNWSKSMNSIIHSKLEKGTLPQLTNVKQLGQQKTQVWVFGSQVQFRPNGSSIPADMINQHFCAIDAIPNPIRQSKGDSFRDYLSALKLCASGMNGLSAVTTMAAFLVQMHFGVVDRARQKMGLLTRPIYFVDSSCQAAMVTLRSISQVFNNFTFIHSSRSTEKIDEIINKSTLPVLVNDDNITEEVIDYCHELSGQTNLKNTYSFMIATKGENLPDVCEARKGEFLISFREDAYESSGKFEAITSLWDDAVENVPFLIRFGNSMNTDSFRDSCCQWKTFVSRAFPDTCYERCGNYAVLMAALELLGNLHGDWTKEDCQTHLKSYLNRNEATTELQINSTLMNNLNAANNHAVGQKRTLIKVAGQGNGESKNKILKSHDQKLYVYRANMSNGVGIQIAPQNGNGVSVVSEAERVVDPTEAKREPSPLSTANISNLITSSCLNLLPNLQPKTTNGGPTIVTQSSVSSQSQLTSADLGTGSTSYCGDQQQHIINTVIGHFIDNIPAVRDPKDFIRSSYRTRDSSDIYIALRLPVLRKLLDVNTRKAFRDILDLHGGQRQQTRFGSDSTSAQLIPRELCSPENLQRIDELMRLRLEQKRFPNRMPMHSGISLLSEHMNNSVDPDFNTKLLRLQDIIGENTSFHTENEGVESDANSGMIKIEETD